jgi:hypothetical protein
LTPWRTGAAPRNLDLHRIRRRDHRWAPKGASFGRPEAAEESGNVDCDETAPVDCQGQARGGEREPPPLWPLSPQNSEEGNVARQLEQHRSGGLVHQQPPAAKQQNGTCGKPGRYFACPSESDGDPAGNSGVDGKIPPAHAAIPTGPPRQPSVQQIADPSP